MMDHDQCHRIFAELSEYVDGTLSENLCADLEQHLSECSDCTVVVNTLLKTIDLYHQMEPVSQTLPEGVRDRLFLRLNLEDYLKK